MYYALIMAGGSGTRLWPLSREHRPKQTLCLVGERSMFQYAVERLSPLFAVDRIWVVTRVQHAGLLQEQVPELPKENFINEPQGRGTAPAIGLGAIQLLRRDPEAVMAVLTADHFISNTDRFQRVLSAAEKVARQGYLVTLGITPSHASTAYGYIEQGLGLDPVDGFQVYRVRAFTEKPNRDTAARMVSSGLYSWNSGMFIWQVKRILEEFRRQMPEFYELLMKVDAALGTRNYAKVLEQVWSQLNKQTIDYGVMEGALNSVVIPVEMGWTDVGSWSSLEAILDPDEQGNIVAGAHTGIDTTSSVVFGNKRLIATVGVKDLVIVDTEDALRVKELVEKLKAEGRDELL
jgi:mannose-1-phosphate guanylyltransferase